ncbi:hypothetical protein L2E82_13048 [Cichorium intybus]|uniref:Uncharacterized protein n=1 Tax=Cichorium intybus TaxID=13427 RepID=A0ACB9GHV6_CICIN|nr:hypothetical protein L2E82_13048 [Cichorium intybus]
MDFKSIHKQVYNSDRRSIKNHQNSTYTYPPPSFPATTATGFPLLAIALACVTAVTFLLLSYFLITKCCYPLTQFLTARTTTSEEPPSVYSTPAWQITGLDESLIRQIPICQYSKRDSENKRLHKCVVCLNEFQDYDTLRVLPSCNHGFHLQCIDTWLRDNLNCPICRLNISGTARCPTDTIGPTSSPQDPESSPTNSSEDFVTIELGEAANESRKPHFERIIETKDEQLAIQPLRRSFSMDSAVDRDVYLSVQDIIRNHEEATRTKRPFFSFGHVRGSRSAILPLEF